MNPDKKAGILLIAIAIAIILATLPFLSGFSPEKGFLHNFYSVGIQIGAERHDRAVNPAVPGEKRKLTYSDVMPKKIQFRFIVALSVVLLFIGLVKLEASRKKARLPG